MTDTDQNTCNGKTDTTHTPDIEIHRVREQPDPDISVVIKTTPDREQQTLPYLESQSISNFEIIRAVGREEEDYRLVAANHGIEAANSEYIALTDDDTAPPPGWLETAIGTFQSNPELVLIEGTVDKFETVAGGYVGCNIAVQRKAALEVGGFDEQFCLSYDGAFRGDTDFGWRMEKTHGVDACKYLPDWKMRHIGPMKGEYHEQYDELLQKRHPERYDTYIQSVVDCSDLTRADFVSDP